MANEKKLPGLSYDELMELRKRNSPINAYKKRPKDEEKLLNDVADADTEYEPAPTNESDDDVGKGLQMQRDLQSEQVKPGELEGLGGLVQNFTQGQRKVNPGEMLQAIRPGAGVKSNPEVRPGLAVEDAQRAIDKIKGRPERKVAQEPKKAESKPEIKKEIAKEDALPDELPPEERPSRYSSQDELSAAQASSNSNHLLTGLARASTQIGGALSYTKPDFSTLDEIAKGNNAPLEHYDQHQKSLASDMKMNQGEMDLQNLEALHNPNHPISKAARDAAKQILKLDLPDNVSAAQLKQAGILGSLLKARSANPNGQKQIVRQIGADGRVHNMLVNKLTGEAEELGESGFAYQTRIDPVTGQVMQVIPSRGLGTGNGGGMPGSTPQKVGNKPDLNPVQKKEVSETIDRVQKSEEYKGAQKALDSTGKIRKLLKEANAHGGQSLAMLGPQVAKGIAGEVGVLTEADVTRYVKNPSLLGGLQDTFMKMSAGKLSDVSVENLNRLLDIMEKESSANRDNAYMRGSEQLSRASGMSVPEAQYYVNPDAHRPGAATAGAVGPSGLTPEQRQKRILELQSKLGQK